MPSKKSASSKDQNPVNNQPAGSAGKKIYANGIDATTGDYLLPPLDEKEAARLAKGEKSDARISNMVGNYRKSVGTRHLGGPFNMKLEDIRQAGWAIVFHKDETAEVRKAFDKLIERRRKQIGNDKLVRVLEYRDGDDVAKWLARYGMAFKSVEPEKVPFYILLVGSPEKIPFSFGQLLDVVYAVGRLYFDDAAGYQAYVDSLVGYETASKAPTGRDVVFWGPKNKNDWPTELSSGTLVKPLATGAGNIVDKASQFANVAYRAKYLDPKSSTKENLLGALCPRKDRKELTPALLFTASHGIGWPNGHPSQASAQGALLCQDYPGIGFGPLKPGHYLAATDLGKDANVWGMVSFHFACYSVGTPDKDRFSYKPGTAPPAIAPKPFFSALAKGLLSHPNGSALGVIGHIERAWEDSIIAGGVGPQIQPFENSIGYILSGYPLAWAVRDFNDIYSATSTDLTAEIEKANAGLTVPDKKLSDLWLRRNDAEGYVLFGDPGASLRKDDLQ